MSSGPKAIQRYLQFLNDWYTERSDSLPEEALTKFRTKYEGVSVGWPDKVDEEENQIQTNLSILILVCLSGMPRSIDRYASAGYAREAAARVGGDVRRGLQRPEHAPHGGGDGAWCILVLAHVVQREDWEISSNPQT